MQTKIAVSQPSDVYEQEADQVADQIMRMAEPASAPTAAIDGSRFSTEENDSIQRTPRPFFHQYGAFVADTFMSDLGPGEPLDFATRAFMEQRFKSDFSKVRIHNDEVAAKSASSIDALAYTSGNHIVFGTGQYNPSSESGKRLLAHELTHVSQQNTDRKHLLQRHICTLRPSTGRLPATRLLPAELAFRRAQVRRVIASSASTYPLASANLQHWLNNTGATRVIMLSEYNFANAGTGIPAHLQNVHRPIIRDGIRNRMNAAHPQSLLPPGTVRVIEWMDSVRAQLFTRSGWTITPTAPLERDLAIALGGFTVKSVVAVRARDMHTVEVMSWRVQVCDRYDWILGGQALIIIPPGIALPPIPQGAGSVFTGFGHTLVRFNDQWMAEIEAAGGARSYEIFSQEFAPPAAVMAAFSV